MPENRNVSDEVHDRDPAGAAGSTRRGFLIGAGKKAAYVTPIVMILTAQEAQAKASPSNPSCVPNGGLCGDDSDCCSGTCSVGACQ